MKALKEGTQAAHASVEALPLTQAMATGTLSRAQYRAVLSAYFALHEALAHRMGLTGTIDASVTAGIAARVEWLRSDLLSLCGSAPEAPELDASRAFACALESYDVGQVLGAAYVLEGAALGNAFLYPQLRERLELEPHESRYFRGHGAGTMQAFHAFGEVVNAAVQEESALRACVAAAQATFAHVERALAEVAQKTRETQRPMRAYRPESVAPAALA
jgi:heme oxygenase (biliverdin-IX-beta and delta-forming)